MKCFYCYEEIAAPLPSKGTAFSCKACKTLLELDERQGEPFLKHASAAALATFEVPIVRLRGRNKAAF
jgi:hypothetical protein